MICNSLIFWYPVLRRTALVLLMIACSCCNNTSSNLKLFSVILKFLPECVSKVYLNMIEYDMIIWNRFPYYFPNKILQSKIPEMLKCCQTKFVDFGAPSFRRIHGAAMCFRLAVLTLLAANPAANPASGPPGGESQSDIFWLDELFDHVWSLKELFTFCSFFFSTFVVVLLHFAVESSYTLAWKIWLSAPGKPHRWTPAEQCVAWLGVV